ncbi:fatty acid desaturase family protein [Parapedobacter lycopersici]|uniref:fatty acid desaturase family protein n=1 Tax=Parapedobacter lycopersici TaxID=1864939 RepID=UPI00214D3EB4|nr:fatty acid desaturase [Parapedobacter lycopersici]
MLLLYVVPYVLMVTGQTAGNYWLYFALWFLMGWGMVGIGTAVMRDANHGTYSPNKKVNSLIGRILEIVGSYSATWKIQHNLLHHTYTNIEGLDDDISSIKLLRFSPRQLWYWFHRYQYLLRLVFLYEHDPFLDDGKGLPAGIRLCSTYQIGRKDAHGR